jgi:AraC family transcriptional regulator
VISIDEIPKRDGVQLVRHAGLTNDWPIPVAVWDAPSGFNTDIRPDHQPCHVIALRLSGSLVERLTTGASARERLRPQGFSVHPPRRELRFVAPSAIRFAHFYVKDAFFEKVAGASPLTTHEGVPQSDRVMFEDAEMLSNIKAYLDRAFDTEFRATKFEMESRANLIAIRFLRHLDEMRARQPQIRNTLAPWQIQRICTHLTDNMHRTVPLDEIALMLGMTKEHLCRAFHKATGVPPMKWQARKRIELACDLLRETDASLTAIAQEVGYVGQSSFGNAFRDIVGVTPSIYRLQARQATH